MADKRTTLPDPVTGQKKAKTPTIRLEYKPSDKEKEMLKRVYDRKREMEQSPERQRAQKQWIKGRAQWEAYRKDKNAEDWQSNHYVPMTTSIVETILSEVVDQSPKPLILPRGSEDIPRAMVMSHVFEFTWDVADGDLEEYNVFKDAFIEGTAIAQEYYWQDPRRIKTGEKRADGLWDEKQVLNYDDCYMEAVKNEDFFVDEKARGFTGPYAARDCIRRYILDEQSVIQAFDNDTWNQLGNVKYIKAGGDTNTYYEYYRPPDGIDHSKDCEVLWYWCVKPDDWLVIVVNDVVVFMGPNPYKHKQLPFARAVDTKRPYAFYGKGQAELLESIQDEINTLRRMVIDRNHLDIDKMFFVSNRTGLSDEDLIARPHGMIPVDDINNAKPIEYNDIPRSVEISLQHLEDDGTVTTGVNPRAQALPTTGTATEAAILKESTLKRIRLKLRLFEREFLTRIAQLRVANILQYYSQPKLEKIVGEKETEQYKQEIQKLESKGMLLHYNGDDYKKNYRQIRLQNKQIGISPKTGLPQEGKAKGFTFFDLNPSYFIPVARGGYDIRIQAGSTLPISKPMQQSKATEMYDRLSQIALGVPGTYDIMKLGDLLLTVNDYNAEDFHVEGGPQDEQQDMLATQIDLATMENNFMMQGKPTPATPYAPPAHTRIHVQFTNSQQFQSLARNDPRLQIFIDHIAGELAAQNQRATGEAGGAVPPGGAVRGNGTEANPTPLAGGQSTGNNEAAPALISGGGNAPAAI